MTQESTERFVPSAPQVEHHRRPLGIGEERPRLTWTTCAPAGWVQSAYELEITSEGGVTSFGPVRTKDQILVPWPSSALGSRESVSVRVRVAGEDGTRSEWSPATTLEAGLLDPEDWVAAPVGPPLAGPPLDERRPPLVRGTVRLPSEPVRARLYVSAHGVMDPEINGRPVSDDVLAPGWTSYNHRLRYFTYDVTELLHEGENALGAWLGDGWYRGRLGFHGGFHNLYGEDVSLIAQLEVTDQTGSVHRLATDEHWRWSTGPIVTSGLYDGEHYDAREEVDGWSEPGFDDSGWFGVDVHHRDARTLEAPVAPAVRRTQEIRPQSIEQRRDGSHLIDFGQNMTGRLRISVCGDAGTVVQIRHAEVLQGGELFTTPLRDARATDTYVLRGSSPQHPEVWEPRFTFHGFRYAEVTGWPGSLEPGDVTAQVLHTDMRRTGWFECSNPEVNQLHSNVVWGMRSNFLDVPTDCPQRDERLGWTGDIQVFAPTASYLFDSAGMISDWLRDVSAEQLPDGTIPWYVPFVPAHQMWDPPEPGALWGDVATLTPAVLHERFGDAGVLESQYATAKRWVDLVTDLAGPDRLWSDGVQLGDWLDPAAPPDDPADAQTDRYFVATAYFARSAQVLADTAAVLDKREDVERYGALAEEVRDAFCRAHLKPDGRLSSDAQTAYALAIVFDLLPGDARSRAGERLAELVAENDNRIATGFAGVNVVSDALSATGHEEQAYALLLERGCPSWLYGVSMGATTIWERWDSLLPDGSVNPGEMTSFNHYALGSVADWIHRVIAGLSPLEPGYRRFLVRPRPGGGITWANTQHDTPYGRASVAWELADDGLHLEVTVPTGTGAVVELPNGGRHTLGPGAHHVAEEVLAAG